MRAAVQHVQHRRRQHAGIHAAQVAIERNLQRLRHGARRGHRDRQNRIRAQLALVRRAVERNHRLVDQPLIGRVHALQLGRNHGFHVVHGLQHALAQVVALVAVAQFHGLMLAGGSARRHNGAAQRAAFQNHVRFHGRDCRANQELRAHEWQQSQSYRSSQCGAAAGHSVWDGDPRQEPLRRRFESCSEAPARANLLSVQRKKSVDLPYRILANADCGAPCGGGHTRAKSVPIHELCATPVAFVDSCRPRHPARAASSRPPFRHGANLSLGEWARSGFFRPPGETPQPQRGLSHQGDLCPS